MADLLWSLLHRYETWPFLTGRIIHVDLWNIINEQLQQVSEKEFSSKLGFDQNADAQALTTGEEASMHPWITCIHNER